MGLGPVSRLLHRSGPTLAAAEPGMPAALIESIPDGVIACDRDGEVVVFNRRARELLGLSARMLPAEWTTPEGPLWRALRGERIRDLRCEVRAPAGERRLLSVSGERTTGPRGRLEGAVLVLHDVTDPAGAQNALRLRGAIADNMAEGVALIRSSDGVIVYVNPASARMFGHEREALVGRHVSVLNAPTERLPEERAQEIIGALDRDGAWAGEVESVRSDGSRFWCEARISAFDDPEHGTLWISVHTDITRRKEAEDVLRDAEMRFRTVFDNGPVGIVLVGIDRRILDVNEVVCEIAGRARDDLIGSTLDDVTHPEDVALDADLAHRLLAGEIPRYRVEKRFVTRRGDIARVALTATVVRGPDDRPLYGLGIVEDLSAQRRECGARSPA
jgi:PAS domain S-box-containing protein